MVKSLAIDDEPGIRSLRRDRRAWRDFDENDPMSLLDLKMPGMDGLAVLHQVRSLGPDQRVIISTGDANPDAGQQVRALGVTEFVEKEFSLPTWGTL